MKKKVILTVVICVLSLAVLVSGGYILFENINNAQSGSDYDKLRATAGVSVSAEAAANENGSASAEPNPIDFKSLKAQNADIYSWLKIPDTNVDYPVLQSDSDDNFYLDHGVNKEYRFAGALYTQFCNKIDYSDRVTVIYGHNMADGSMFADLLYYADPDFFENHGSMTVYTADRQLDYEVVSAFEHSDEHIMNSFDFSDDKVYGDFLGSVLKPHAVSYNVRENASLDTNDRIVILSTCLDYGDGRWLVVGKLKGEKQLSAAE